MNTITIDQAVLLIEDNDFDDVFLQIFTSPLPELQVELQLN